ncbi:MAG: hypothetical protein PHX43_04115 [Alphaproteobacteria bacterium]|nr:hypothetical protein [Alphaproteobacteria bacterium]
MKIQFTPQVLDELKREISKSLVNTLHVMFGLDVSLTTSPADIKQDRCVRSCIELGNATTKAILVIAIPYDVAEKIAENFQPETTALCPEIVQEVSHEIANIVVHAIRTHLISSLGLFLDVKLPQAGMADNPSDMDVVSLYFLIRSQDTMGLDFLY